jgi:flavin reductase (DIM6/NTAB) family NADH-FMN oxidoreductase RutF
MKKIEMGSVKPQNFVPTWDGQYSFFSHLEFACGIPNLLFAITTLKENGQPNVCFHSWSTFCGDGQAFHAILGGLSQHGHTYKNIQRTGEFVVNFLSKDYYDSLIKTIQQNGDEADEFAVGGFTKEASVTVKVPRIQEAFLSLECKLTQSLDLSGAGIVALVTGKVEHIAMREEFAKGIDEKYGENGFMFNIHAPKDLLTGKGDASNIGVLKIAMENI